jgi:fructose/tagatose bisphosphate aldolase
MMTISLGEGIFTGVRKTNLRTDYPQPLIESASTAYQKNQRRIKKFHLAVKKVSKKNQKQKDP